MFKPSFVGLAGSAGMLRLMVDAAGLEDRYGSGERGGARGLWHKCRCQDPEGSAGGAGTSTGVRE